MVNPVWKYLLGTAVFVLLTSPTAAEDCSCKGKLVANSSYHGGDGSPLNWEFSVYLVRNATNDSDATYCFFKNVRNESDEDVWSVRWMIAGYGQRRIPAKHPKPSCPQEKAKLEDAVNGNLEFGLSNNPYETTVRMPKRQETTSAKDFIEKFSPISSDVSFYTKNEKGEDTIAELIFTSSATKTATGTTISYSIENVSDSEAKVLVNLPATDNMYKQVPFANEPIPVKAKDTQTFEVQVDGEITPQSALIVLYDQKREEIAAVDTIGLYAPQRGTKAYADERFWTFQ